MWRDRIEMYRYLYGMCVGVCRHELPCDSCDRGAGWCHSTVSILGRWIGVGERLGGAIGGVWNVRCQHAGAGD